ncbi:MAG: peptidase S1, partial [Treponema sp.]|nr:peptidase S1 [Treponema sp.]
MKLYSRGQVLFFSVLSVFIVVMFTLGVGLLRVPAGISPASGEAGDASLNQSQAVEKPQHSNASLPVNTGTPYTEDERENISIYERLNGAVVNITTETVAINWFLEPVPQEGGSG